MEIQQIEGRVRHHLMGLGLMPENLDLGRPLLQTPGLDSMRLIQLVTEIEKEFGLRFEAFEILDLKSWSELFELIQKKGTRA